jgi:serine/threonine protein kinase
MIKGLDYDYSTDWWSYGVLAYELLCKKMPYSDNNKKQMYWEIENVSPRFPAGIEKTQQQFLHQFFCKKSRKTSNFHFNKRSSILGWNSF